MIPIDYYNSVTENVMTAMSPEEILIAVEEHALVDAVKSEDFAQVLSTKTDELLNEFITKL